MIRTDWIEVVFGEPDDDCPLCRERRSAGTDRPQAQRGRTAPAPGAPRARTDAFGLPDPS